MLKYLRQIAVITPYAQVRRGGVCRCAYVWFACCCECTMVSCFVWCVLRSHLCEARLCLDWVTQVSIRGATGAATVGAQIPAADRCHHTLRTGVFLGPQQKRGVVWVCVLRGVGQSWAQHVEGYSICNSCHCSVAVLCARAVLLPLHCRGQPQQPQSLCLYTMTSSTACTCPLDVLLQVACHAVLCCAMCPTVLLQLHCRGQPQQPQAAVQKAH
jgi:hypothetical protein